MKNAIKYYYEIEAENLKYDNPDYIFKGYVLKEVKKELNKEIYNLFISNDLYIHHIIYNTKREIITIIDNKKYILLKVDKYIKLDIKTIVEFLVDIKVEHKNDWSILWANKVDYYEKYISKIHNKDILAAFNYYIGLSECAIRIYKEGDNTGTYSICHDRLNKDIDFYSPTNIIYDYKVRDIAEYIKISFFKDTLDMKEIYFYLEHAKLLPNDYLLLYSRLLFPTYFFDCLEDGNDLLYYSTKINSYERLLDNIYKYISLFVSIPKLEWLIKK